MKPFLLADIGEGQLVEAQKDAMQKASNLAQVSENVRLSSGSSSLEPESNNSISCAKYNPTKPQSKSERIRHVMISLANAGTKQ